MRIYFARHGESQANILKQISNRGLTHGLTRKGRAQAVALAEKLAGVPITRIYSSPLLRAVETAVLLAHRLELDYEVVDALREFDSGIAEGRADETGWNLWRGVVQDWLERKLLDSHIEGGESFEDMRERFVPFVEGLVHEHGNSDAGLLCVAHGGVYWAMLPLVVKNIDQDAFAERGLRNAACIVADLRPEGLVCVEWNGETV